MDEVKKPKNCKELIKLFNVNRSRYDDKYELTLKGWFNLLYYRSSPFHIDDFPLDLMKQIVFNNFSAQNANSAQTFGGIGTSPINDTSLSTIWEHANSISTGMPSIQKKITDYYDKIDKGATTESSPEIFSSFHTQVMKRRLILIDAIIDVDLNASDEDLVTSFTSWLKHKRNEARKLGYKPVLKKAFSEKDCKKWADSMLLEYLDLQLCSKAWGIHIPYHAIGDTLYPDDTDVDVAERVRKVVKPLADKMMQTGTLGSLISSIATIKT